MKVEAPCTATTDREHVLDVRGFVAQCRACKASFSTTGKPISPSFNEMVRNLADKVKAGRQLWRHHEDCKPISREGCICGLWEIVRLAEAVEGHLD